MYVLLLDTLKYDYESWFCFNNLWEYERIKSYNTKTCFKIDNGKQVTMHCQRWKKCVIEWEWILKC